jgi:hypothetical protein
MGGIFGVTYLDADMEGTYFGSLAQDISKNNVLTPLPQESPKVLTSVIVITRSLLLYERPHNTSNGAPRRRKHCLRRALDEICSIHQHPRRGHHLVWLGKYTVIISTHIGRVDADPVIRHPEKTVPLIVRISSP